MVIIAPGAVLASGMGPYPRGTKKNDFDYFLIGNPRMFWRPEFCRQETPGGLPGDSWEGVSWKPPRSLLGASQAAGYYSRGFPGVSWELPRASQEPPRSLLNKIHYQPHAGVRGPRHEVDNEI